MHTIDDLMRLLGYNENQVRVRLREFRSYLDIRNGKNNKLLVSDSGFKILERVKDLEQRGFTLDSIKAILNAELNLGENGRPTEETTSIQTDTNLIQSIYKERVDDLKLTISMLQAQFAEKDSQIQQLHTIIKELEGRLPALPPGKPEADKRVSRWARLKQLIRGV